jgi:hypothetical protein
MAKSANVVSAASALDFADMGKQAGQLSVEDVSLESQRQAVFEKTVAIVAKLHKARFEIGRKGKCSFATAYADVCEAGGLSAGSIRNRLSDLRAAVEAGKFTGWNTSRNNAKGSAKGKTVKGSASAGSADTFPDLMLKVFNHAKGRSLEKLCDEVQALYQDDKILPKPGTFYKGVCDWMAKQGFEVKL